MDYKIEFAYTPFKGIKKSRYTIAYTPIILNDGDFIIASVAKCGRKDQFCKAKGRNIALNRLGKLLTAISENNKSLTSIEIFGLIKELNLEYYCFVMFPNENINDILKQWYTLRS